MREYACALKIWPHSPGSCSDYLEGWPEYSFILSLCNLKKKKKRISAVYDETRTQQEHLGACTLSAVLNAKIMSRIMCSWIHCAFLVRMDATTMKLVYWKCWRSCCQMVNIRIEIRQRQSKRYKNAHLKHYTTKQPKMSQSIYRLQTRNKW